MLRMTKNLLSCNVKRQIYFAHIHSHILYGLSVWGKLVDEASVEKIFKVQKECVRLIKNAPTRAHSDPLFKQLRIPTIRQQIKHSLCKIGYMLDNKLLPKKVRDLYKQGLKTHQYETRNKNIPNLLAHSGSLYNKSFLCRSIAEYLIVPTKLKKCDNLTTFNQNCKSFLLQ